MENSVDPNQLAFPANLYLHCLQHRNYHSLTMVQMKYFITQPSIYGVIVYFLLDVMSHLTIPPVNKFDYRMALYHGLVTRFPVKNRQALIDMSDNDAHTVPL